MMAAGAIAVTLGTMATIAVADDRVPARNMQDLLDRGFEVIAEGRLLQSFQCDPESSPITLEQIRQPPAERCFSGKATYGSFKRLKGDNNEFICVSFRDWACYQSQNSN
jgi:hypothetical protein